jgi:molybdopterin molybdotransferase
MDGYAVAHTELALASPTRPVTLDDAGLLPAGSAGRRRLRPGEAVRIMTGAPLPAGADAVVPVEAVRVDGRRVQFQTAPAARACVRRPGENFRRGDRLLAAPVELRPQDVGLCITAGVPRVAVARRVRVGVLSTGSELVAPATRLRRGEVFDSNRPMILAQVAATGAVGVDFGAIGDRLPLLAERVRAARRQVDFLITVGGVSAGDFDIVKLFLRSYPGVQQLRVAMRPARPQAFGRIGRLFWYALPGNPVSAWVAFDQLVRPLLLRSMGHRLLFRRLHHGRCQSEVRSPRGLVEFVRAFAETRRGVWHVRRVGPEGSSNIRSLAEANALLVLPERCERVRRGDLVTFELLADPPARPGVVRGAHD